MSKLVSVIVTTKNEEKVIKRLLRSLKNQSYKNIEIIVVDNNSDDNTRSIVEKFSQKIFISGPERSSQRNYGAKKSSGEYLFFLDADMEPENGVIEECVSKIRKDIRIGGVVVPEIPIAKNFWEKVKAFERSIYNEVGDIVTDAARFFRQDVFEKAGGYDETLTGPEDWDITETIKKIGFKIGRIKSRIYHYERIPNPFFLTKKKYYYALNVHKYLSKHKISPLSPKTVYFLRPIFYKSWHKLISNPIMTVAMFTMFFFELMGGGVGYFVGRSRN